MFLLVPLTPSWFLLGLFIFSFSSSLDFNLPGPWAGISCLGVEQVRHKCFSVEKGFWPERRP
ncbi:hypothetical protein TRIATDRAFT_258765 [Trichoderma atroviride IMI 206040]|uniref:Uncharacterized protein n=1 Tax=Hypocrea atroviridis (strain ATCC 20476 / IMI 206040) TaxID=452589 RepID=G9P6H8_HYPAI|nr:uncharacterized protein TRIATDRAFT_258765 [Trichoderma atroviride IMI 206040]EHK40621.1 hypothetical protein TRIATDRAFT_258765 [Trichoderma atroviride IMI 206040]